MPKQKHDAIGLKDSRHLFIQSEVKPKPIVTRSHAFSRALRQPHVITSSFDWFNVLSVSYVIGQSNYFGFGFTTLKRKPLYIAWYVVSGRDKKYPPPPRQNKKKTLRVLQFIHQLEWVIMTGYISDDTQAFITHSKVRWTLYNC